MTETVNIDHRVFPRLIGPKGRTIRKIMEDYKVDIRFPPDNAPDPDAVEINGKMQSVSGVAVGTCTCRCQQRDCCIGLLWFIFIKSRKGVYCMCRC